MLSLVERLLEVQNFSCTTECKNRSSTSGMVAALSGVFGLTYVEREAEREKHLLEDHLTMDH